MSWKICPICSKLHECESCYWVKLNGLLAGGRLLWTQHHQPVDRRLVWSIWNTLVKTRLWFSWSSSRLKMEWVRWEFAVKYHRFAGWWPAGATENAHALEEPPATSPTGKAPPRVSQPILKRCLREVGWITLVASLPLSAGHEGSTSNSFRFLLGFYTPKIQVWWNNSKKMAYCPCRGQGHSADKQRTPLHYRPGLLHPAIFRVKKPNSTNRICACGYLVCLGFE